MAKSYTWSFSADGNGSWVAFQHTRELGFSGQGTWGGGTVTLQYSNDGGTTAITVADVSLAANGTHAGTIRASYGTLFRPVLAGATSPNLKITLGEVI